MDKSQEQNTNTGQKARHRRIHTIWFQFHKVQNQEKSSDVKFGESINMLWNYKESEGNS